MKNTIDKSQSTIELIYDLKEFGIHIKRKGAIIVILLIVTFLFFFSLPLLNSFFPDLMKYQLAGSFNVGLLWVILQYPIGAIVAWIYARKMMDFDSPGWIGSRLSKGK